MKRCLTTLLLALAALLPACAMSYDEARDRAWYLTDKMAYELDLTQEQYDRAYQINLDYLMSIRTASDCTGPYWTYRNADLRCVLLDWQYELYSTLDYFFRPIRWVTSAWYLPVFARYEVNFYYFPRPAVYISYHGHSWLHRRPDAPSPYYGWRRPSHSGLRHTFHGQPALRPGHRLPPSRPGRPGGNSGRPSTRPGRPGGNNDRPSTRPGHPGGNNDRPSTRPVRNGNSGERATALPWRNVSTGQRPAARPIRRQTSSPRTDRSSNRSSGATLHRGSSSRRPAARPSKRSDTRSNGNNSGGRSFGR